MNEYLHQKRVCCQSRPAFFISYLIMAAAIVFSGPLVPAISVLIVLMRGLTISHAQIQYFLPRTESEIKRQSIVNVMMICMETAVCMVLWMISSLVFFERMGRIIREFPVFIVLWILAMILSFFWLGFSAECHQWSGADSSHQSFLQSMRQDISGTLTGFLNTFLVIFIGYHFCFGGLQKTGKNYQNPAMLLFLIITIVLTAADIFREMKAWTLADYR